MTSLRLLPALWNQDLYEQILTFWLPTYPNPTSGFAQEDVVRWFGGKAEVDAECRRIAGTAVDAVSPDHFPLPPFISLEADREIYSDLARPFLPLLGDKSLPRPHIALVSLLILDQMPRNLFRGDKQAVVYTHYDRLALALSTEVHKLGIHQEQCFKFSPVWRYWLELPLQHSESLDDHRIFAERLQEMLKNAREAEYEVGVKFMERALVIEEQHLEPLKRFGRYPWRNRWLGRESTAEEERYLKEDGKRFVK